MSDSRRNVYPLWSISVNKDDLVLHLLI